MSLFERQKMRPSMHGIITLPEVQHLENGSSEVVYINQATIPLPDPSVTDLSACLKAGIPLKRVDSKVLGRQYEDVTIGFEFKPEQSEQKGE